MTSLTVRNERRGPVLGRHPWLFSRALKQIPDGIESGTPIRLVDEARQFLAAGYFNSYSQIAVRIWGYDESEEIDQAFFERRIESAYGLRKRLVEEKKTNAFRVVNAENDALPGFIVDKYGEYLSIQFHTKGIERWREQIVAGLRKVLKPKGIFERSDLTVRGVEQTPGSTGLLYGNVPERVKILENGFQFWVDIMSGQKTGFFLDQRDKRQALMKYCKGKSVLNAFAYTGGFSVYALGAGAKRVVSIDSSESAIDLARENILLNKLNIKKCEFVVQDVKSYLPKCKEGDFDVIILDPPAFIKDRRKKEVGMAGYKKLNEAGASLLRAGGILLSCSCSAHLTQEEFRYLFAQGAGRAGKALQIIESFTHGIDHPVLASFPEGEYLKCFFATVR